MKPLLHTLCKFLQPLGFAFFLIFFLLPVNDKLFYAGLVFTGLGMAYELWYGLTHQHEDVNFNLRLFLGSFILKLILIAAVCWRVIWDGRNSALILLAVVVVAILWNIWINFFRPDKSKKHETDVLDNF
jgi:hypothetical protein